MADGTVIIKRIKKGGHGGHHGGAWKVAYADFVTAMMAFFLLMWLINTTTPEQKRGIADYFAPQSIAQTVSGSGGVLGGKVMGEDDAHAGGAQSVMQKQSPPSPASTDQGAGQRRHPGRRQRHSADSNANAHSAQDGEFAHAAEAIRQAIQDNPDLANLSHQVILEQTPQGLRIQLVDQDGRPMFQQGTNEPMPYTKKLLAAVGGIIDSLPNRVSISGHTGGNDATPWQRLGTVVRPRQRGPRRAAGGRPGAPTAFTKWPARPVPSRCCRKTPTPRPTGGCPSCCCARRRRARPGL